MADWTLPTLTSAYADFLSHLRALAEDAGTLGVGSITNPISGHFRYVRADNKFQEYSAGVWGDKQIAVAGGGTGSNTAAGARTNLGIGGIATQEANNVTITGGTISNLGSLGVNGLISGAGNLDIEGQLIVGSLGVTLTDATGKIPAISSSYFASLSGVNLTNLNASNLASGTVPTARLGSGTANSSTFLRGDGSWASVSMVQTVAHLSISDGIRGTGTYNYTISPALTDYTKAVITHVSGAAPKLKITTNSNLQAIILTETSMVFEVDIVEFKNVGA